MNRFTTAAALLALVAIVVAARLVLPHDLVESTLHALPPEARAWAAPLCMAAFAVATVALLPTSPIALAAGAILGPAAAFPLIMVAAMLGSFAAFALGRRGSGFAQRLIGARVPRLLPALRAHGVRAVIAARMPPIPFGPASYALGIARVRPRDFVVGTLVGAAPAVLVLVFLGAAVGDASRLASPGFVAVFVGAIVALVIAARRAPAAAAADEEGAAA